MDAADGIGISLFVLAVLIVTPVLLYPPLKTWLDQRDHRRRMSRAWREGRTGGLSFRKRRARKPKGA